MLDIIFSDALIVDGNGGAPFRTDLAVVDDRIALIGALHERDAFVRVDASGLALAPGFIDVHAHSDELWLAEPLARGKIHQGVTTEIGGNCGTSAAPLLGAERTLAAREMAKIGVDLSWERFDEFFAIVEREGIALNVASLVGLGTTRASIGASDERKLTDAEMVAQARLVREAVEHGALGVSSGLIYDPSRFADEDELVAMAIAGRDAGAARYVTHLRDEGDDLIAAVDEALRIGARAEVAVQCSHHKAAGKANWGKVHETLERIDAHRAHGHLAAVDVYPYVASWMPLVTVLPDAARAGDEATTLARLRDPEAAASIALSLRLRYPDEFWHDVLVTDAGRERNADLAGMRIDEIARAWHLSPQRAVIRLLAEEALQVECAFFVMDEDDVATVLSAEFACIGSDASARALDGVTAHGVPHPRTYGCFPRVFGRFVRGRHTLTMEEAVRRMTSLPADLFGLRNRGRLVPGAYADLVVFDPDRVRDRATYEQPFVYPEGIAHVVVNGEFVVRDGATTGARPGRVLRGGGPA